MFVQNANLSELWSLDVLGIKDPVQRKTKTAHQQEVLSTFRDTIRMNESKGYEVRLPWKENHPPLLDNRELAECRLNNSLRKLRDKELTHDYEKIFDEWLNEGIIERVLEAEINRPGHYLPHRPVLKENSTTPIRPVFDASAKQKGHVPLNQCVETGPNLIEQIPSLLLRFRRGQFGIIADIRKAFLQISVSPEDRHYLRFLWKRTSDPSVFTVYRHCRVVFGVSSSLFLLGATIDLHLERICENSKTQGERNIINMLRRSFYVDNCVTSVHDEQEMSKFRELATRVMIDGGFDLRGWEFTGQDDSSKNTPLLGLTWDTKSDTLSLARETLTQTAPTVVTKRVILSSAQKIFDPVGMVCPVVLGPKILLQKLWSSDVDWDTPLEGSVRTAFLQWQHELEHLSEVRICRWAFGSPKAPVLLHLFVDASKNAYAAVVFSRVETPEGVEVHLLEAKSRVAPKETTTIPRLELLAATVGARLLHSILDSLEPQLQQTVQKYCWSDSTTVLSWLRRQSQWGVFVWNRTQEICKLTQVEYWRPVPGHMNPADLPSRGCTAQQLIELRWWEGPAWLKSPPNTWPKEEIDPNEEEVNSELKKTSNKIQVKEKSNDDIQYDNTLGNIDAVLQGDVIGTLVKRLSRYSIILRVMARVLRVVSNFRRSKGTRCDEDVTTKEVELAEILLLQHVQKECFTGKTDPRLATMNVYVDKNDLLRLKSLVENRADTLEFRCPVILDYRHILVTRLIEHTHRRLSHAGTDTVMNNLRERFWILSCRRAVNSIVRRCTRCTRYHAKRLETPPASLPERRVRPARVFEITGMDYAGPLYLKDGSKLWICVYTCAVYRSLHLEPTSSLSTDAFFESFRRFVSRRGHPTHVYTNNGTNFIGAQRALRAIDWKRVTEDPEQLVPLIPALFLRDVVSSGVPDVDAIDASALNKRLKYQQELRDHLHHRFRLEYLGQLARNTPRAKRISTARVGDVVLVGNDQAKRLDWPLGRIIRLYPGKDGVARVAQVKTAQGELLRPLQRLYPLEVGAEGESFQELQDLSPCGKESIPDEQLPSVSTERAISPSEDAVIEDTPQLEIVTDGNIESSNEKLDCVKETRRGRVIKPPARYQD